VGRIGAHGELLLGERLVDARVGAEDAAEEPVRLGEVRILLEDAPAGGFGAGEVRPHRLHASEPAQIEGGLELGVGGGAHLHDEAALGGADALLGLARGALRGAGLAASAGAAGEEGQPREAGRGQQGGGGDERAVAPGPARGAAEESGGPRPHRLAADEAVEVVGELHRARVATRRLLLQALEDDGGQVGGRGEGGRVALEDGEAGGGGVVAREGALAGEQGVEGGSQAPDVGAGVERVDVAARLLGLMYAGVPSIMPDTVRVEPPRTCRARPKSRTRTRPARSCMRFAGLRSR
jgi:hypothetical protein